MVRRKRKLRDQEPLSTEARNEDRSSPMLEMKFRQTVDGTEHPQDKAAWAAEAHACGWRRNERHADGLGAEVVLFKKATDRSHKNHLQTDRHAASHSSVAPRMATDRASGRRRVRCGAQLRAMAIGDNIDTRSAETADDVFQKLV